MTPKKIARALTGLFQFQDTSIFNSGVYRFV